MDVRKNDIQQNSLLNKKNAKEMYGMLRTAFGPSCMNRSSVFEWHKRFEEGRESEREFERCRSKEVRTPELMAKGLGLGLLCWGFKGVQKEIPSEETSTLQIGQWYFHQDNVPVHNCILVTYFLTKMGIKTVPDLAPCDFWLFPKLSGCRYETIEEMKEAVTKAIHTLT